jgi:hypothetical protein
MSVKGTIRSLTPKPIRDLRSSNLANAGNLSEIASLSRELRDLLLTYQANELRQSHQNPMCRYGKKCFSQTDEDGITLEILRRINCLEGGVFAEYGVGDGTENNTLILKALGWKGFWVGAEKLAFAIKQPQNTFSYFQEWITLHNIEALTLAGCENLGCKEIDVISVDLDGNDIYIVESLLKNGHTPKLFIVEYNAKFIPPVKWQVDYDATSTWLGDDYFGASLATFNELFQQYAYRLVCCNAQTGANAFFVSERFSREFADVPDDLEKLYAPPSYSLYRSFGHKPNIKTIAKLFA